MKGEADADGRVAENAEVFCLAQTSHVYTFRVAVRTFENVERVGKQDGPYHKITGRNTSRYDALKDAAPSGTKLSDIREVVTFWPSDGAFFDREYALARAVLAWGKDNVIGVVPVAIEEVDKRDLDFIEKKGV